MKKKFKLLITLSTFCLAVATLCFGVLAAKSVTYKISGLITYEVENAFVEVNTKIFTSPEFMSASDLTSMSYELGELNFVNDSNFTRKGLDLFVPESQIETFNSKEDTSGSFLYDQLNLEINEEQKTFFVVINVKNLSETTNVWAVVKDEFEFPDNVLERNNGIQQKIEFIDNKTKNIVIGITVADPNTEVVYEAGNLALGIEIGTGNYATSERNLNKLKLTEPWEEGENGTISLADTQLNTKGVVVIPSMVDGVVYDTIDSYFTDRSGRVKCPGLYGKYTHLIIEEGITSVCDINSSELCSLEFPSTLTNYEGMFEVSDDQWETVIAGTNQLSGCEDLDRIKVAEGNPYLYSDETCRALFCMDYGVTCLLCGTSSGYIPTEHDDIRLGSLCFAYKNFTEIFIPKEVMYIGHHSDPEHFGAFYGCPDLKMTFEDCSRRAFNTDENWTFGCNIREIIGSYSRSQFTYTNGKLVFAPGEYGFGTILEYGVPELILEIEIPRDSEIVDTLYNFSDFVNLQSIVIPSNITSIEENTFNGCVSLGSVVIENNNISIGARAFKDCPIENVEYEATDVDFVFADGMITSTGDPDVFDGDPDWWIGYKNWPELVLKADFSHVSYFETMGSLGFVNLREVTIPNNCSIGEYAFDGCNSIETVHYSCSGEGYSFEDGHLTITDVDLARGYYVEVIDEDYEEKIDFERSDFPWTNFRNLVLSLSFDNSDMMEVGYVSSNSYNWLGAMENLSTVTIPDYIEEITGRFGDKIETVKFETTDSITIYSNAFDYVENIILKDSNGVEQKWTNDDGETYYVSTSSSLGGKHMNRNIICDHVSGSQKGNSIEWTVCPA